MPIIKPRAEKRFKELLEFYFDKNLKKHADYLLGYMGFKKYIDHNFNPNEFLEAVEQYKIDKKNALDRIFNCLKPLYEAKLLEEKEKAMKLVDRVNRKEMRLNDLGNGKIQVESESRPGTFFEADLINHTCSCELFTGKGKPPAINFWTGIYDKHQMLAHEFFGHKYHKMIDEAKKPKKQKFSFKKSEDIEADSSEFIVYGKQKLKIREKSDNSFIPGEENHILEGGAPEIIISSLNDPEDNLHLIGPSGCGKTTIIKFLANKTNTPLIIIAGNHDITADDFIGTMTAENGTTKWNDGALLTAMKCGYWLMIQEPNAIMHGCQKYLDSVIDFKEVFITSAGTPIHVKAHPDFRLICCSNPPDSPLYKGVSEHSFEFIDRFTVVNVDYADKKTELKLIKEKSGNKDAVTIEQMLNVAKEVRNACNEGKLYSTITTRGLINFAKKNLHFDIKTAAEVTIFSKMNSKDREAALRFFNSVFKIK